MFNFERLPELLQIPILNLVDVRVTLKLLQVNKSLRRYSLTHGISKKKVFMAHHYLAHTREDDVWGMDFSWIAFKGGQQLHYSTARNETVDENRYIVLNQARFAGLLLQIKAIQDLEVTVKRTWSRGTEFYVEIWPETVLVDCLRYQAFSFSELAAFCQVFNPRVSRFWELMVGRGAGEIERRADYDEEPSAGELSPSERDCLCEWIRRNLVECQRIHTAAAYIWELQDGLSKIKMCLVEGRTKSLKSFFSSVTMGLRLGVLSSNPEAEMIFECKDAGMDGYQDLVAKLLRNPEIERLNCQEIELLSEWTSKIWVNPKNTYERRFFRKRLIENGRQMVCMSEIQYPTQNIRVVMRIFD